MESILSFRSFIGSDQDEKLRLEAAKKMENERLEEARKRENERRQKAFNKQI